VAAIELDTDLTTALMQPGVHAPDGLDLLRALLHRPAWQAEAACSGKGPARWFPTRTGDPAVGRTICTTCPVRTDCLEYALAHDVVGFWAGTSPQQRDRARRRGIDAETMIAELG
jgi:WhiB family transcriptional regulator, redox-sensing transcriptional regulator